MTTGDIYPSTGTPYPPIEGHAHTCSCASEECRRNGCAAIKACPICNPQMHLVPPAVIWGSPPVGQPNN